MVEYVSSLDTIFSSLADPTRRDILERVFEKDLSVSEIAEPYDMSMAAVSKHLKVLEKANLVRKIRHGKEKIVSAVPDTTKLADQYLKQYQRRWEDRFDSLDIFLKEEKL